MSRMEFDVSTLGYIQNTQSIILDYAINIKNLRRKDQMFDAGALGNFSLAGFEMVYYLVKYWSRIILSPEAHIYLKFQLL